MNFNHDAVAEFWIRYNKKCNRFNNVRNNFNLYYFSDGIDIKIDSTLKTTTKSRLQCSWKKIEKLSKVDSPRIKKNLFVI